MNLSPEQLKILRHMLGIDIPWKRDPEPYRNRYCAAPGNVEMQALEQTGAVTLVSGPTDGMPYDLYACTEAGIAAARASHKTIRYSKGKRLYRAYLRVSDAFQDLSFKDFLSKPDFQQCRQEA